jgi:hypothetical protein
MILWSEPAALQSDDWYAGIKKDKKQHEAAHKGREGYTYQCLPKPHGSRCLSNCAQHYHQRNPCYGVSCEEYRCHLALEYLVVDQACPRCL